MATLALQDAGKVAACGRVNLGPAHAQGPAGSKLLRKQKERLTLCITLLQNIHALPCAPGETSGKQELPFHPGCTEAVSGCGEES